MKPILDAIPDKTHYVDGGNDRKAKMRNTDTDTEATSALLAALEPFRAANPTMTLQQLISFLLVAKEEGLTVSEYARRAGLAQGVMTRNLFDLGEYNRRKAPGLELVEQRPDLLDRRAHLTYLTHKGRGAVGAYRRALEVFCARR